MVTKKTCIPTPSQMVIKNACIPTPSQTVTKKKNMLSHAKSNGNEKSMLSNAKSNSNTKLSRLERQLLSNRYYVSADQTAFFSNGIQISAGFAGLFGFDRKSVRIPVEKSCLVGRHVMSVRLQLALCYSWRCVTQNEIVLRYHLTWRRKACFFRYHLTWRRKACFFRYHLTWRRKACLFRYHLTWRRKACLLRLPFDLA